MRRPAAVLLLILVWLAFPAAEGIAQTTSDENGGLVGLVLPVGVRVIGQARAVTASRGELQALPYNPAAVHGLERGAVTYSRFEAAEVADLNGNYVAGAYAGGWGTVAGHVVYQDYGTIPITDTSPDPIGSIELAEWVIGVTYANLALDRLAYGATAKWYRSDLGAAEASGPAFDAGVVYTPRPTLPLSLAVSLRNLGPDLDFEDTADAPPGGGEGTEESLPGRVRIGLAVFPERFLGLAPEYAVQLLFDIESDVRELSNSSQHLGAVLTIHDVIVVRGGFLIADNPFVDEGDEDRQIGGAFGIGLRVRGFEADIAREVSVSELGDETHFGVGWRF